MCVCMHACMYPHVCACMYFYPLGLNNIKLITSYSNIFNFSLALNFSPPLPLFSSPPPPVSLPNSLSVIFFCDIFWGRGQYFGQKKEKVDVYSLLNCQMPLIFFFCQILLPLQSSAYETTYILAQFMSHNIHLLIFEQISHNLYLFSFSARRST